MKISINGSSQLFFNSIDSLVDHARQTKADGFDEWWLAQASLLDALTVFPRIAAEVPGLGLGTAVVPTFPRHPVMLAGQALTAQAMCDGRVTLGIGLSHRPTVEDRWGLEFDRPVRHMIDYLEILQSLLHTGTASHKGEIWRAEVEPTGRPSEQAPSVVVAALGPQMLKVAGSRTDGTILWLVGPDTIRDHIAPRINEAAAAADRPAPRVIASLPVSVTDDVDGVLGFVGAALAGYDDLPSYKAMLDREGAGGPADVAIVGDEDTVEAKIRALADAGATDFAPVEFGLNDEDAARTRALLKRLS